MYGYRLPREVFDLDSLFPKKPIHELSKEERITVQFKALLTTLILIALTFAFAINGGNSLKASQQMEREGVDTTAVVEKSEYNRSYRAYRVTYTFDVDNTTYTGTSTYKIPMLEGDHIRIRYRSSNPNQSEMPGSHSLIVSYAAFVIAGFFGVCAGVFGLYSIQLMQSKAANDFVPSVSESKPIPSDAPPKTFTAPMVMPSTESVSLNPLPAEKRS